MDNGVKIEVTEDYLVKLKDVFNPVVFESKSGETLSVCERDGTFEILTSKKVRGKKDKEYTWYRIKNGVISEMGKEESPWITST